MGWGRDGVAHENQVSDQTGQDSPTDSSASARRSQPPTTPVSPPPFHWRGTGAGEIPPLKNFVGKSNPSSNNLSGTLQRYGTLFERGVAWTLSLYRPYIRADSAIALYALYNRMTVYPRLFFFWRTPHPPI
jgi:hypothetical protein